MQYQHNECISVIFSNFLTTILFTDGSFFATEIFTWLTIFIIIFIGCKNRRSLLLHPHRSNFTCNAQNIIAALSLLLPEVEFDNFSWTSVVKTLLDKLQGKLPSTPGPLQDAYSFRRSISSQTSILAHLPLNWQIVLRRLTQEHCCVVITLSKMFENFI